MASDEMTKDLLNRIRTVKGHLGGIEKMIEQGKACEEIMMQISAVKAAIDKIGTTIVENYAEQCLVEALKSSDSMEDKLRKTIKTLLKMTK